MNKFITHFLKYIIIFFITLIYTTNITQMNTQINILHKYFPYDNKYVIVVIYNFLCQIISHNYINEMDVVKS